MADEYVSKRAVCYQLDKRATVDGQPRAIRRAMRIVQEFPSADVQPVRHGRWTKMDMHKGIEQYKCSVCRSECYVPECMGEPIYAYCPNCGAIMDQPE